MKRLYKYIPRFYNLPQVIMIRWLDDEKYCGLYCTCGCENGVVLNAGKDEDLGYYISLVSDNWYTSQLTGWTRFKEKCKRIWKILSNKEHHYFGICLDNEDIKEFKEFVAKL